MTCSMSHEMDSSVGGSGIGALRFCSSSDNRSARCRSMVRESSTLAAKNIDLINMEVQLFNY